MSEKPKGQHDEENLLKENLYISGMTCATCAKMVEQALLKVDGVSFAAVNLATESAFVILEKPLPKELLEKAVRDMGYDVGEKRTEEQDAQRYREARNGVILSWLLTIPMMFLMVLHMSGAPWVHQGIWKILMRNMTILEIVSGVLVLFGLGRGIFKSAWIALSHRHSNMDVLVALGAFSAWCTTFISWADPSFSSFGTVAIMIVALHLTGRYVESRLRDRASKQVRALLSLSMPTARLLLPTEDGKLRETTVPIEALKEGNTVVVFPGELIPVDGKILSGSTTIDESMLTGESLPVVRSVGEEVTGGSMNLTGAIQVTTQAVGEESFLARMANLIQEAQGAKIPIQAFADRVTNRFVPIIFSLALLSGLVWLFLYWRFGNTPLLPFLKAPSLTTALNAFISTLVIACPCALGLAIPMALVAGTGAASKRGLLIRNAEAVQTARDLKVVVLDKTGTLTEGRPRLVDTNLSPDELDIAASIEKKSTHPLALAISSAAPGKLEVSDVRETAGEGVRAAVEGSEYFVGRPRDAGLYASQLDLGRTVVELSQNQEVLGFIAVEDPIREDAADAVKRLSSMGLKVVMATGDNERTARSVAKRIGLDAVRASLRPDDKLDAIREYQKESGKVLMAGDGINDAAALKGADIGVAMSAGSDLAIENADIVIVKGGVGRIADAVSLSRSIFEVIRQNLFWAFAYNVIAVPLAMLSILNPVVAELAMAASSISVVLSSMRVLRHFS
ncbi:MAG: cation-translocating P-type ATPase [Fretibacterium sp.]|nr:cation-translocating P-type ATPase [Fretibacterium sp.]